MEMIRIDTARLWIFAFREGALSPVGHDLRLSPGRMVLESDGHRFRAQVDLSSLRIDGVMRAGRLDPVALDEGQKRQILGNLRTSVLHPDRHPAAIYEGTVSRHGDGFQLTGELALEGQRRALTIRVDPGRTWRGEVTLIPSRWGVRPYRAMLGALRTADRVVVRFELEPPEALREAAAPRAATEAS